MPIVKVEYRGEKQYCSVPQNSGFVEVGQAVVDTFNLSIQNAMISITDHQDAKIKTNDALQHVISKCAENIDYFLKISFGAGDRKLLTPQILLRFISETGGSKIAQALNHHKSTGQLTVSQRRLVLHAVADYLVKENGYYPTKDCKKELAHVVVSLFPCLSKKQGDNVIEFVYGGRKGGWLMNALKARRAKDNVMRPQNADGVDAEDDELESIEYSVEEAAQDVEYLKMTKYDQNTAAIIEEKLKLTAVYRHNLLDKPGVNIVRNFPYMITHPHLILQDYEYMHPANCSAFTEKWPIYSKSVSTALALYEKSTDFFTCFSSDIEPMLGLLKLLTPNQKGRKNNNNFQNVANDFITFLPIGTAPKNALKKNFDCPYILASGHDQKNIIQYYIVVEREIITPPTTFTFDMTFDLFFKLHFVFNMRYGDSIKSLMEFVEAFIFESGMVDTSDKMDHIFDVLTGQVAANNA